MPYYGQGFFVWQAAAAPPAAEQASAVAKAFAERERLFYLGMISFDHSA
jgi:hypothetical protein